MRMTNQRFALLAAALAVVSVSLHAYASADAGLSGQWAGNSRIDGEKSVARTLLTLGATDAENSTLRIEGANTCTLRHGKYSAGTGATWSLSFK